MTAPEDTSDRAPDTGPAGDVSIGDETAELLMQGRGEEAVRRHSPPEHQTTDTPDELGGTGGENAGGAG